MTVPGICLGLGALCFALWLGLLFMAWKIGRKGRR